MRKYGRSVKATLIRHLMIGVLVKEKLVVTTFFELHNDGEHVCVIATPVKY